MDMCGLSALRIGALNILGRLYPVFARPNSVCYSYQDAFIHSAHIQDKQTRTYKAGV